MKKWGYYTSQGGVFIMALVSTGLASGDDLRENVTLSLIIKYHHEFA
jgi:hypothetical protein